MIKTIKNEVARVYNRCFGGSRYGEYDNVVGEAESAIRGVQAAIQLSEILKKENEARQIELGKRITQEVKGDGNVTDLEFKIILGVYECLNAKDSNQRANIFSAVDALISMREAYRVAGLEPKLTPQELSVAVDNVMTASAQKGYKPTKKRHNPPMGVSYN